MKRTRRKTLKAVAEVALVPDWYSGYGGYTNPNYQPTHQWHKPFVTLLVASVRSQIGDPRAHITVSIFRKHSDKLNGECYHVKAQGWTK